MANFRSLPFTLSNHSKPRASWWNSNGGVWIDCVCLCVCVFFIFILCINFSFFCLFLLVYFLSFVFSQLSHLHPPPKKKIVIRGGILHWNIMLIKLLFFHLIFHNCLFICLFFFLSWWMCCRGWCDVIYKAENVGKKKKKKKKKKETRKEKNTETGGFNLNE